MTSSTEISGNSQAVTSNQTGPHPDLEKTVRTHLETPFEKPFACHSLVACEEISRRIAAGRQPLILDAGCGTGDSTRSLASHYPDHLVIGIDRSENRLTRQRAAPLPPNALTVRADLEDVYRLLARNNIRLARHFILYPNPYPKSAHLKRRWHGSPVFPSLLALGGEIDLRSNWKTYTEEFAAALTFAGIAATIAPVPPGLPLSPFEKKYALSGHKLWRLTASLDHL